jgi:arylsulfatase A-like enzyme
MKLHTSILLLTLPALVAISPDSRGAESGSRRPPNVIFFATDDLNDWVAPLGRSIRARTPNLDRLAARGVTFTNAHTAGTYCAPSRTALFTGRHPSTTGAYETQIYFRDHPDVRPMQVALQQAGYSTWGTGKLFHHPAGFVDLRGWTEFHVRTQAQREAGWPVDSWRQGAPLPDPMPYSRFTREYRSDSSRTFMEYAPLPDEVEKEMADTIQTDWAIDVLKRPHDRPFFLALGLYAPHFPNYAPKKYYDLYPLESIQLPPIKDDDSVDLPPAVRKAMDRRKETIHEPLARMGLMREVLRAYLACISYADAMLGRVLDALESSPHFENTIVVFWSDHGYHHGEKGQWGKHTLWQRTTNIPFIWAGPGIARAAKVGATVSSIDVFPTLVEMCRLAPDAGLEGQSMADALRRPEAANDRNVLVCEIKPGGYAVINRQWRYIHYADGTEELYDLTADPHEWVNLAGQEKHRAVIAEMKRSAPAKFAPPGADASQLRLVPEGERFRWEPKPKGTESKKAKARRNEG